MQSDPVPLGVEDRLNVENLSAYLRDVVGLPGPVEVQRFPAGHSNLTYLVRCGDRELVLKQAPHGPAARSAHDMHREYTVLSKIHDVYPYAPRVISYCEDSGVIGSTFCLMERLHGQIIRTEVPSGADRGPDGVRPIFFRWIEALVELHRVDANVAGLANLGRPEGYVQRQIDGWSRRLDAAHTDDAPDFSAVVGWLRAHVPGTGGAAVIHNDFKLDNLVWSERDPSRLVAVLDWEMATIGDPLMDLGCTLSFWVEHEDPEELQAVRRLPSARADAPTRREALAHYQSCSGRAIPQPEFYLCYGFFRRAVIELQKYSRFKRGETADPRFANLIPAVQVLRRTCEQVIEGRLR